MVVAVKLRCLVLAAVTGLSLTAAVGGVSIVSGALTPAQAQGVSAEFQSALEPYGEWRRDARWGEVWVPDQRPRGWRPYTVGHWVYTDDWGWFWVSDDDEADWGWVTYHYGRWMFDRGTGWYWVPGDEWAPAWVNWRRGDNYVGWAPLAPEDVTDDYDADPDYWVFVEPRYMASPRPRNYYLSQQRMGPVLRSTVLVNRSFGGRGRIGVNPGISPALIGAASRSAVPTFRVRPRVLASTQGVSGGVAMRPQDLRARGAPRTPNAAPAVSVQRTTTLIQPAASVAKPQALGKGEPGRLGSHPPRAAQGAPAGGAPAGVAPQQQQQNVPAPPPGAGPRPPGPGQERQEPRQAPPPPPAPVAAPLEPPPGAAPPRAEPPRAEPPRPAPPEERREQRPPTPPPGAPAVRPAEPAPQARPERPMPPQTPPPEQLAPRPERPPPPVHQAPPPPPVAHPAPPPPPAARPAPPPPPVARPGPPPPPAARPAPPPAAKPAAPPPKPGEKPPEPPK